MDSITARLIQRMETAEEFGYDDEAVELSARLARQGKDWKWSDSFFSPTVIIFDRA